MGNGVKGGDVGIQDGSVENAKENSGEGIQKRNGSWDGLGGGGGGDRMAPLLLSPVEKGMKARLQAKRSLLGVAGCMVQTIRSRLCGESMVRWSLHKAIRLGHHGSPPLPRGQHCLSV